MCIRDSYQDTLLNEKPNSVKFNRQEGENDDKTEICKKNSFCEVLFTQKRPNELGNYDMSGNVYEWVADNSLTELAI